MAYTTINKFKDHFNTNIYTGNGSNSRSITGVGFQPDWIWIKNRVATQSHFVFDAVRGVSKAIFPDSTAGESTQSTTMQGFGADGMTVGTDVASNGNGNGIVSWNWKANGAGSANTDGDINSTVSVNQTAGFSIVKYTGNGSNDQRIGHGLGARPVTWFIKNLSRAEDWIVYHQGIASNWYDDSYFYLNTTDRSMGSVSAGTGNPTTSVFYIGSSDKTGKSGDSYIAYVFAEKSGYSRFGSYWGNGNDDGPMVYTGFAPAWVLQKEVIEVRDWTIADNVREVFNPVNNRLVPNETAVEVENNAIDLLSHGFKIRQNQTNTNEAGKRYIYWAFGQSIVGTNNKPNTAK